MRNRFSFVCFVVSWLSFAAAGCNRGGVTPETRERAYQANNRGVALLEQFKYPEAAAAFREALQTNPSLPIAHFNLSLALFYARDLTAAAPEASEAARLLPSSARPHYVLGLIAYAENRAADARREFDRVREIDPADVGAAINLAQLDLAEQKYPDAIARLRPAVAVEPFNVTAVYNFGLALSRGGAADEGRQMLERAQTLRSVGYATTYGTGYLEQGRYAEAIASTGAEPDLVDAAVPQTSFSAAAIASVAQPASAIASPFGRSFTAADLSPDRARDIAAGLGGAVTLIDADGDGALDLFAASADGQRLFRNGGRGAFTDVTAASGLSQVPPNSVAIGCIAGDYDNDGRVDLFVLRNGGSTLYHNDGGLHFTDDSARAGGFPYPFLPGAAAFVDVDHDGDLDLLIAGLADLAGTRLGPGQSATFPKDFAAAPLRLFRNNGNGTFTDITTAAGLTASGHAIAIVPTDFDNRRDVDLLIVNRDTAPSLFQNLRDGTFGDVAAAAGLGAVASPADEIATVSAADINNDDFPDFFFGRTSGGVFALSDGRGRFTVTAAPDAARAAIASQLIDYDNDGLFDLLAWSDRLHVFRNLGQRWMDVSTSAALQPEQTIAPPSSPRAIAFADLNGDAAMDFVTGSSLLTMWRNSGTPGRRAEHVVLKGRASNRLGIGSKVQLRAGSLGARIETSAATPSIAPADVTFGLGARAGAEVVRVLWPSGILQAEAAATGSLPSPTVIEELDRKPSSCPFLFTWNGERFEFVTDFMGGGEMGYWEEPARFNTPDPIEYVRIRSDQLRAKDGRYELRVTNELEETLFADRLQLIAVAHPSTVEIYPNEGMSDPPKPFRVFAVSGERVPHAIDDHGHDVTDRVATLDHRYPDDFDRDRYRGYAATHTLRLDLSPVPEAPVLLLTGWTDYAFSSDNVAAHQAGRALVSPSLEIKSATGHWRTAVADIGIPVGRPQTIPIDLAGLLRPGEHEVRIVTNMRIYWDIVRVGSAVSANDFETSTIDPSTALLRERGFSAEIRPEDREPPGYDYAHASRVSPWKTMTGWYTTQGDVRDLLTKSDDLFVIAKPGDEIALTFDAPRDPLRAGWTRTFLLFADGFSKEMDLHSASPELVGPLPFHAMSRYPYSAPEHYPDSPAHQEYQAKRNTRLVAKPIPFLSRP